MKTTRISVSFIMLIIVAMFNINSANAACDCTNTVVTGVPQIECEALVALYNSTNGAGWTNKTNWDTTTAVSSWYGVTVPSGYVQSLALGSNQVTGSIPSSLGNLTNLQFLDLSINQLTGNIPPQLGSLTNLVLLGLFDNQLTGSIPSQLGNLTNLQTLYLNNNQLTGNIPLSLGNLINLQQLALGSNQLTGNIPSQLGNLTNLQQLSLGANQLTGSIPLQLGNLTNLQQLNLVGNQLTGSIPSQLGNLINMQYLDLRNNQLTGSIPVSLINLTNLSYLGLDDNCLSTDVSNLTLLNFLNTKNPAWSSTQNACGVTTTTATLSTSAANSISYISAISGGNITSDGNCAVTARGVCWSTSPNPTIANSRTTDGSGTGVFASSLTGLTENTTYYVRAYATNCKGTSYGNEISFITASPTSGNLTVGNVGATSAVASATCSGTGITERGFYWWNNSESSGTLPAGSGAGDFSLTLNNLKPQTTYNVSSYIKVGGQLISGEKLTFTTAIPRIPTVHTNTSNFVVTTNAITVSGEITDIGSSPVTIYGFVYATHPTPTVWDMALPFAGDMALPLSSGKPFTGTINNLSQGQQYYARAYAHNTLGTVYGEEIQFTTLSTLPTLNTSTISSVSYNSAVSGGNITSSGSCIITARGVCWATSSDPTIANSHTTDGTGAGAFTSTLSNLNPNTTYYVRAYATNCKGTSYGSQIYFNTTSPPIENHEPQYINGAIFPNTGTSGGNFTFECTWQDPDNDYVVDVKARYKKQGSTTWIELPNTLDFVLNTNPPRFRKTVTITGEPGTYEYQFQASDANPANGPRKHTTSWQGGGIFAISGQSVSLKADLSATPVYLETGKSVSFFDQSTVGSPATWSWTFQGGSPATSDKKNPTGIVYNTEGTYSVILTVSDGKVSDTKRKDAYIVVVKKPSIPSKPVGLTATATSPHSVRLKWNNIDGADYYKVYFSISPDSGYFNLITTQALGYDDPQGNPGRTYYYKISAKNAAGESELSDYVRVDMPSVDTQLPDLIPLTLKLNASNWLTGSQYSVELGIQNRGKARAGAYGVQLYISSSPSTDSGIKLGYPILFAEQDAGNLQKKSATITVPDMRSGQYYLLVLVDPKNEVDESDGKMNNQLSKAPQVKIVNSSDSLADLSCKELEVHEKLWLPGQNYTVRFQVQNTGKTEAFSHTSQFYLSKDMIIDPGEDTPVGSEMKFDSIAPEGVAPDWSESEVPIGVPYEIPPGEYYLGVLIDSRNDVPETDEINNSLCVWSEKIKVPKPNEMVKISGRIYDANSAAFNPDMMKGETLSELAKYAVSGLADVEIEGFPNPVRTASDGTYEAVVEKGWSGEVTPKLDKYHFFTKSGSSYTKSVTYTNVTVGKTGQNYLGFSVSKARQKIVEKKLISAVVAMQEEFEFDKDIDGILAASDATDQLLGIIGDINEICDIAQKDKYDIERYFELAKFLAGKLGGPAGLFAEGYIYLTEEIFKEVSNIGELYRGDFLQNNLYSLDFHVQITRIRKYWFDTVIPPDNFKPYVRAFLRIYEERNGVIEEVGAPELEIVPDPGYGDERLRFKATKNTPIPLAAEGKRSYTLELWWNDWTKWNKNLSSLSDMEEEVRYLQDEASRLDGSGAFEKLYYLHRMVFPINKLFYQELNANSIWIKLKTEEPTLNVNNFNVWSSTYLKLDN